MNTLNDITLNIVDGVHGDCTPAENSGRYFISVKDMKDFRIDYSDARQISIEDFEKANQRTKLEVDDVLFANTGDTIGKMLRVTESTARVGVTTFQKSIAILKPDQFIVSPLYFYYLIRNNIAGLRASAVGSSQKNLLLGDMKDYKVKIRHERNVQDRVIQSLYTIDRKIENNASLNDTLQKMANLIYDYWFVQFEFPDDNGKPYRSTGGVMVWNSELQREIPQGWNCVSLGSLLYKNTGAFDYATIEPTIDLSVMPSSSIALNQLNSSDKFATNLFKMIEGDILFGSIRPYLKKAGIAPCDGVVAGTIHSYNVFNDDDYNFALFTLCRDVLFDYAVRVSTGTKMPVVSSNSILSYKVPYSKNIAKKFNTINVKKTICQNVQETHRLIQVRDWLLPMLMYGQAIVTD